MSGIGIRVAEEVGEGDGGKGIVVCKRRFVELDHGGGLWSL